ncbi:hypothetical protein B0I35DRAFT_435590 [Stachybotrys elegans]|uniref:Capsule polysaccharide biosynthesis protein n=1 Tax=Stachybotrys elegans TaxID=80388 RepID=A0A8K0WP41_9HYPO|nr:hypothetical protein B0I35DRAFT_435590 [Stachybotrys elegans]
MNSISYESEMNRSHGSYHIIKTDNPELKPWPSHIRVQFSLDIWSIFIILLSLFLFINRKHIPGIWHLRLLNGFRYTLKVSRPPVEPSTEHIFQPIVTESSAPLLEIDFNLHKTNSSYFADLDVSRTHLVCTLFAKGIEKMRGGTGAYTGANVPALGLALGAVSCNFRKEILPHQEYEVWSKILSWDNKWVYIVTHFVKKDKEMDRSSSLRSPSEKQDFATATSETAESADRIFATALSRCVWKMGRKTVAPDDMFRAAGLLPAADDEAADKEMLQLIEDTRQKGLRRANGLVHENQKALEAEFCSYNGKILDFHEDGTGMVGVLNTLLQLAHLRARMFQRLMKA